MARHLTRRQAMELLKVGSYELHQLTKKKLLKREGDPARSPRYSRKEIEALAEKQNRLK
jgi:hypothetical protein